MPDERTPLFSIRRISSAPINDIADDRYIPPSYGEIIGASSDRVKKWHEYLTTISPEQQRQLFIALVRKLSKVYDIHASYFNGVKFDAIDLSHLAGEGMWVPAIEFTTAREYRTFLSAAGLPLGQGYSVQISIQDDMRPVSIILYSAEQLEDSMHPDQIRLHEGVHAVDPNLEERKTVDGLILSELIATIGELTQGYDDIASARTAEYFWMGYYSKLKKITPDLLVVLRLDVRGAYTTTQLTEATVQFVSTITAKRRNTDIVKMMMKCTSFGELLIELKKMFPRMYSN